MYYVEKKRGGGLCTDSVWIVNRSFVNIRRFKGTKCYHTVGIKTIQAMGIIAHEVISTCSVFFLPE